MALMFRLFGRKKTRGQSLPETDMETVALFSVWSFKFKSVVWSLKNCHQDKISDRPKHKIDWLAS